MTARVYDFPPPTLRLVSRQGSGVQASRTGGLKAAGLAAIVVVPLAGAAEPPAGWLVAALTALTILSAAALFGSRIRWAWLAIASAVVGIGMPRGNWAIIGPPLFVSTLLCLILWLTAQAEQRAQAKRRRAASRERSAQLMQGLAGERQVGGVLGAQLPADYAVINGLQLARAAGDIDHVVVGPTGVFLLETKTMAGRVVCAPDGTWRRTRIGRGGTSYAAYIGDPTAQVQRNIFAVRQVLRKRLPDLCRSTPLWVEGLVVFPHPRTELEAHASRVPALLLSETTGRICTHTPRRSLQPEEVDAIVGALLAEAQAPDAPLARRTAQALVEYAALLPVVLILVFGTIGVSRYVQAHAAVVAVAHEAARAGALASSPSDAIDRMHRRVEVVAPGLGLDARLVVLNWDLTRFGRNPGQVEATVDYPLDFGDLPLVGSVFPTTVRADHVEWVDPFRSGVAPQPQGGS